MIECWCGNKCLQEYSKHYYMCNNCGTLISKFDFDDGITNISDEENDLYGRNYWTDIMLNEAGVKSVEELILLYLSGRVPYWVKHILKHVKLGGSVAEIGCGLGQLSYILKLLQFKQTAYELSPQICAFLTEEMGLNAECGELGSKKEKYDTIVLMDVFEHLLHPLEFIQKAVDCIKDDGVLVIQTPCFNPEYSFDVMRKKAPAFEHLLIEKQHIYLYSRNSISVILKNYGFNIIQFEPAFFGDGYDMFLFASRKKINENSDETIKQYMSGIENGKIIQAWLMLFDKNVELAKNYSEADDDRVQRNLQISELNGLLAESESNNKTRLLQIEELTKMLKESDKDREARQEQVEELTQMLKESDEDREARQEQVEELTQMLKESDKDREARQEQVEELTQMLKESDKDREARQEQIDQLTELLQKSEADKENYARQIKELTVLAKRYEEDGHDRLDQINTLTNLLKESEADRQARWEQILVLTDELKKYQSI